MDISTSSLGEPDTIPLRGSRKMYGSIERPQSPESRSRHRCVPIELVSLLIFTQTYVTLAFAQFFLHDRAKQYYSDVDSANMSSLSETRGNSSASDFSREDDIQELATLYLIVIIVCIILPSVLPVLLMGALSDIFGRKILLYMSSIGMFVFSVNAILVVMFDLSVYWLCPGAVINGLCGYFGTLQTALFSIVADITEPGSARAWRIVLLSMSSSAGNVLGSPIAGIWIDYSGFLKVLYFTAALNVAALLVSVFCIPETNQVRADSRTSFKENLKKIKDGFSIYIQDTLPKRRTVALLCLVTFLISFAVDVTKQIILGLYLLARPFYWSPTHITLYLSIGTLFTWLIIVMTSKCLSRCMSDVYIAIIGAISTIGSLVLTGVAFNDAMMYVALAVSVYSNMITPMVRSLMSRTASPSEQGSMFSVIAVCEMFSAAVLLTTGGIIYDVTLPIFPGFVFILLAIFALILLVILIILSRVVKATNNHHQASYKVLGS